MAESIQAYYEKLIAKQSESIRKNLVKYELTEWERIAPTLTNKEREYIINGFKNGLTLRAVSFFRKIVSKAQLNAAVQGNIGVGETSMKKNIICEAKKDIREHDYCIINSQQKTSEEKKTAIYIQESRNKFEILFNNLSPEAQQILLFYGINSIEKLLPWMDCGVNAFLNYLNCSRLTSGEIKKMVRSLSGIINSSIQSGREIESESQEALDAQKLVELYNTDREDNSLNGEECAQDWTQTAKYGARSKEIFDFLIDNLSIRAQHILLFNDINCIDDLAPWIKGERKDFLMFRNCGRRTSGELMAMVLYLRKTIEHLTQPYIEVGLENKELHNLEMGVELHNEGREEDAVKRNECVLAETKTDKSTESDRKIFDFLFNDLSIRAQNILRYNNINCIEDLTPWIKGEFNSFLKFRNCGKRTSEELMEMVLYLRAKVDLSCQFDSESAPMNQEKKQSLLDTIAKASENKIQSQRQFDRLFNTLSVRTRNVLRTNGILDCESLFTLASKPVIEIMKLPKCGKKTVQELLEAANRLQKIINEAGSADEVSIFPFDGIIQFDEGIQNYLTMFKKEHGHWPMVFVLFSTIKSLLKPREFAAFEDRYGIWKHEELEELSKQGVHQIFERTVEKLYKNIALKKLCEHEDWSLYNVNIIPVPFSNNEENNRIWWEVEKMIANEKCFLKNCFCDNVSNQ